MQFLKVKKGSKVIFDSRWNKMQGVEWARQNAWKIQVQGSKMCKLNSKVKYSRKHLLEWRKVENTNARKKINDIKGQMDRF